VLDANGIDPRFVEEEIEAMGVGAYAKTASRSVLGVMNEFAYLADVDRHAGGGGGLVALSVRLAHTPTSPLYKRHVRPDLELRALVDGLMP
jgi:hypothetical protein